MPIPKPYVEDTLFSVLADRNQYGNETARSMYIEPWKRVSFASNWHDYNVPNVWGYTEYTKDRFGFVHIRGLVAATNTPASGEIICTLPVRYRPASTQIFPCVCNGGLARIDVNGISTNAPGTIGISNFLVTGATALYLSLAGISFWAEPT